MIEALLFCAGLLAGIGVGMVWGLRMVVRRWERMEFTSTEMFRAGAKAQAELGVLIRNVPIGTAEGVEAH